MYRKMTRGALLDSTSVPKHSQPVALGSGNCAMFEVWVISTSGTVSTVTVSLEASADGQSWDGTPSGTNGAISTTLTSSPSYVASVDTAMKPAFSQVRLKYELAGTSTPKAMLDAAIRTYVHD